MSVYSSTHVRRTRSAPSWRRLGGSLSLYLFLQEREVGHGLARNAVPHDLPLGTHQENAVQGLAIVQAGKQLEYLGRVVAEEDKSISTQPLLRACQVGTGFGTDGDHREAGSFR